MYTYDVDIVYTNLDWSHNFFDLTSDPSLLIQSIQSKYVIDFIFFIIDVWANQTPCR